MARLYRPGEFTIRTFRPGGTLAPLAAWAAVLTLAAVLIGICIPGLPPEGGGRWTAGLVVAVCVTLGPVALVAHSLRRAFISVTVDWERGLVLSGRRAVPWPHVERIEHREALFRGAGVPSMRDFVPDSADGCGTLGCLVVLLPTVFFMGAAVVFFALFLCGVILPVLSLFSPWHSRVIVQLGDGRRIVYHDLENDEDFVRLARACRRNVAQD
ncbi:MAG: hypothetical protein ACYTAF_16645 [Planctomycetota bacterium]|jgi:hypothetical protein